MEPQGWSTFQAVTENISDFTVSHNEAPLAVALEKSDFYNLLRYLRNHGDAISEIIYENDDGNVTYKDIIIYGSFTISQGAMGFIMDDCSGDMP